MSILLLECVTHLHVCVAVLWQLCVALLFSSCPPHPHLHLLLNLSSHAFLLLQQMLRESHNYR